MRIEDEYEDLNEHRSQFINHGKRQKTGVIKSSRNNVKGILHIEAPEETEQGVEFFQPIKEGDLIVGVIHKCSCGKTSELRFQYSD